MHDAGAKGSCQKGSESDVKDMLVESQKPPRGMAFRLFCQHGITGLGSYKEL
jgi:hypothetical protein